MKKTKVESSHIASIGYEPGSRTMHVEYKNGSVYEHRNVPEVFHKTFMSAESPGEFFHKNIRPFFEARRIK